MTAALTSIAALLLLTTIVSTFYAIRLSEQTDLAESAKVVSNIQIASFYVQSRSTAQARRILKTIPKRHRNWEWAYLADQAWPYLKPRKTPAIEYNPKMSTAEFWQGGVAERHQQFVAEYGGIRDGQFTADGNVILSALDGSMGLYSLASGTELDRFVHPDKVAPMSRGMLSPDGTKLVAVPLSGWPLIFDLSDAKRPASFFRADANTLSAGFDWAWSPNQEYVVSAHFDKRVRFWSVKTLEHVGGLPPHERDVRDLYFDKTGEILWTASTDGTIRKWSFPEGAPINDRRSPDGEPTNVNTCPITENLRFQVVSPDRRSALAIFENGSSFIWNVETLEPVTLSEADSNITNSNRRRAGAFSPDGSCVAIMRGQHDVAIFDVKQAKRICQIEGYSSSLRSIRFSPDGTKLMTTGENGTAIVWTAQQAAADPELTLSNAHDDAVYQIDFDESGKRLLSGSFDRKVRVSDLATGRVIATYEGHSEDVVAVDFHKDGKRAASLDRNGNIHVWQINMEAAFIIAPESDRFANHMSTTGGGRRGEIFSFPGVFSTGLFSPDGLHIVSFQKDGMKVFDAQDGSLRVQLQGASDAGWPVYSHDSKLVSVVEMDGNKPRIWDLQTGKLVTELKGHKYAVCMMSFSPNDDRIVVGGMAQTIIWNARTGERQVLNGRTGYTASCRFSSDGQFVLTGHGDHVSRVWDSRTGILLTKLQGHTGRIRDVRFNPDETRLVSWATDDQVIIWDTARLRANLLIARKGASRPLQAHWTPDGRDIVTSWTDGSIEVWSGANKHDISKLGGQGGTFEGQFNQWRNKTLNSLMR